MSSTPSTNHELQLAYDFVQYTGCNIFLTGKAGTGKTTFLRNLRTKTAKRMIVTAPTGVAAINAGGVTLHSFFQLPFGPFVPGSETYERHSRRQFRFSKEKKRIIRSLDLLVIDEISMVRADVLDAVDAVLRRHRHNNQPFGGVQLMMIGDLHQLSPVAKPADWELLQHYYDSVYFFSSTALARTEFLTIELRHIYRQSDVRFIKLLNQVRDNRLDESTINALNDRYVPQFEPDDDQGYIILTTHNNSADSINQAKLQALPGKEHRFQAEISGDFSEHLYPAPADLRLKKGAQVMLLRNDPSSKKLYYNGKIGKITGISSDNITVSCPGDRDDIKVEAVNWDNIKYTVNEKNQEIEEDVIGTFKQYPLKPAWAITIHKSQGLTFDKAIIDARAAFAHGQVYVALSRCTTLEGMILSSPISPNGAETDEAVQRFDDSARRNPPSADRLLDAKIRYQQQLLLDCFDFQSLRSRFNYFVRLLQTNAAFIQVSGLTDIRQLSERAGRDIFIVSENFRRQLTTMFTRNTLPETDAHILERISKASTWFQEKCTALFGEPLAKLQVETDNSELQKKIDNTLNNLEKEIAVKRAGIQSCQNGFSPAAYLRSVSAADADVKPAKAKKRQAPDYTESDISHPEMFRILKDWRAQVAGEQDVPRFQIMHQRVLIQIAVYLPDTITELKKIKGVGKKTIVKYGQELVAMVNRYRRQHGIEGEAPRPETPVRSISAPTEEKSPNTKQISYDMLNRGFTIAQIAKERGLVQSTIESHLNFFVAQGKLDINRLLPPEKQQAISEQLDEANHHSLSEIKNTLGDDYSYGEIKMMLAHRNQAVDS